MKILIYNSHSLNIPGKRSPDGKFFEASHNREIAKSIVSELKNKGYDTELLHGRFRSGFSAGQSWETSNRGHSCGRHNRFLKKYPA